MHFAPFYVGDVTISNHSYFSFSSCSIPLVPLEPAIQELFRSVILKATAYTSTYSPTFSKNEGFFFLFPWSYKAQDTEMAASLGCPF